MQEGTHVIVINEERAIVVEKTSKMTKLDAISEAIEKYRNWVKSMKCDPDSGRWNVTSIKCIDIIRT